MNPGSGILLALLAAGQSRRFGERDKLAAPLGGSMLGLHAAAAGAAIGFSRKLVIGPPDHRCADGWRALGFEPIDNAKAAEGQASSVRLAAEQALAREAAGLCILLADMPFVTPGHIATLIAAFERAGCARTVASARAGQAMPPALFPRAALPVLVRLEGDSGARALLAEALLVAADPRTLMDVDTADDLASAENFL